MLDELAVSNFGVLDEARIEPRPGLVVVTGETGTGKTLLLGALRLLLGHPARKDQIGPHGDELTVEGRFLLDDCEIAVARRIDDARSRAYLDGSMIPARVLAEKLGSHVEIVGQHDALSLSESAVLRELIDSTLPPAAAPVREAYLTAHEEHEQLLERKAALGGDQRSIEREIEVLEYQAEEIEGAGFAPGDDTELASRAARLRNAGALAEALSHSSLALEDDGAAVDHLGQVADRLLRAARLDTSLGPLAEQAGELVDQATALAGELRRLADDLEHDEGHLDEVERRLGLLGELRRKYGDSLEAILAFGESARARADGLRGLLDDAAGLDEALIKARSVLGDAAAALTAVRREAAVALAGRAVQHLQDLGFSDPVVDFDFASVEPAPHGADRITLRFASDAALTPLPVGRAASGGELSRLVLSVRLAAADEGTPVLAFDEIDAGLGGATAYAMGAKLAALARGRQVLCVTHLPQVAAFATDHYVVERKGATGSVRRVAEEQRTDEITRMLAGLTDSASGRDHAAELLARAASAAGG